MTRPRPRHATGEQVLIAITSHPEGIRTADIMLVTHQTYSQVRTGLRWVRDVAAAEHMTPLTYTRKEGWRFSDDPSDWRLYESQEMLKILFALLRLTRGTVDPHGARLPEDRLFKVLHGQTGAMIAAAEFTIDAYRRG